MTDLITEFAIRSSPAIWESGLCIGVFGIRCDLANHSDVPRPSETNAEVRRFKSLHQSTPRCEFSGCGLVRSPTSKEPRALCDFGKSRLCVRSTMQRDGGGFTEGGAIRHCKPPKL